MLRGQDVYGKNPLCVDLGPIALGRGLVPTVPEDANDRGPLVRGPHALVADVRIDNRQELERNLGISRSHAAELPDAAILFEALLAWGTSAFERIVGEFACAFWNGAEKRLLLA